jgi:hypothetical protein
MGARTEPVQVQSCRSLAADGETRATERHHQHIVKAAAADVVCGRWSAARAELHVVSIRMLSHFLIREDVGDVFSVGYEADRVY